MHILKTVKLTYLWELLAVCATFLLSSQLYVSLVAPIFNFGGMIYNPRADWYLELLLLLFTALLLLCGKPASSSFYNWLFYCTLLIPSSVLSAEQGSSRIHLLMMFSALWLSMFFRQFFSQFMGGKPIFSETHYEQLPYRSVLVFIFAILIFLAVSVNGAFNVNFEKVYDFRFDISESMPLILRYLMPLAAGTLIGYIGALVAHRRKILGMVLVAVVGVLFFGFSSHKSMLFNPMVAMICYYLLKLPRPHLLMLWGLSLASALPFFLPEDGTKWLGSLFASRVYFLPSHINFQYFDLFGANDFMLWAESKISFGLVRSCLPLPAMKYVGGMMTGNYEISANTGWVANAYMNGGVNGIVTYAIIIGLLFAKIDSWGDTYGRQLVGAAFFIPVNTLILSADLFITLLTTGLFVLILIFVITTERLKLRPCRT